MSSSFPPVGHDKAAQLVNAYIQSKERGDKAQAEDLSRRITALSGKIFTDLGTTLPGLYSEWSDSAASIWC